MMPLVMRKRNESIVFHTIQFKVAETHAWLREDNRAHGKHQHASLPSPTPEAFLPPASNCIFLGDCFKKAGRILCQLRAKRKMSPFKP
jgi:hypothetical protein